MMILFAESNACSSYRVWDVLLFMALLQIRGSGGTTTKLLTWDGSHRIMPKFFVPNWTPNCPHQQRMSRIQSIRVECSPRTVFTKIDRGLQRPQTRTGPQSIWTKFERLYRPTPPALHFAAAFEICRTDRDPNRKSTAGPLT